MELFYERGGVQLYHGSVLEMSFEPLFDLVIADPPYRLSNGGITCQAGEMVPVDKGEWDKSDGLENDHEFDTRWLTRCRGVMRPNASIWVSGTHHNIYSVGFAMQRLGYRMLNDIAWFKVNPPPNLSCRTFTHAHERLVWAARSEKSKYTFNYAEMKAAAGNKQMKSLWPMVPESELPDDVWAITPPPQDEKALGKHPAQKPVNLMKRCIVAASNRGDAVLDPFVGTGASAVAAVLTGRRFVGIDIEKRFLEIAAKRVDAVIDSTSE